MSKYNLGILDPLDFEEICADILTIKLSIPIRTFKPGADGGIDGEGFKNGKKIIVQCKRYNNFDSLKTVLKKELPKLELIEELEDYYIMVSLDLNPQEEEEIYKLFQNYMTSAENIITGKEIEKFLDIPENIEILKRHPKLWLSNSYILDLLNNQSILIDSDVLIDSIQRNQKFYVHTKYFYECLRILQEKNCILITGDPGVGKTTLSNMLILYYLNEYGKNLKIRYSSCNNFSDIKKSLSLDEKPEVVLIDDFLGQIYDEVNRNNCNDLISLISFIQKRQNKIIILNSRIGILKNVFTLNEKFKSQLETLNLPNVNISNLNVYDKGRILYNYLTFKINDKNYLNEIINEKFYWKIIRHQNYNPRLIERITDKNFYENISPENYPSKIILILDNPSEVWKEEFEHHITKEDQLLLTSLFSLTNYCIEEEHLKNVFMNRAEIEHLNFTISNKYEDAMARMIESYIKIVIQDNKKMVSMINNSLNDYLNSFYISNPRGLSSLIETCNYTDQLVKLSKWNLERSCENETVIQICLSNKINGFNYIKYPPCLLKVLIIFQKKEISEEEYYEVTDILFSTTNLKPFTEYIEKGFKRILCGEDSLFNKYIYSPIKKNISNLKNLLNNISQPASETLVEMFHYCDEDFLDEHYKEINKYINDAYYFELYDELSQAVYDNIDGIIADCCDEYAINNDIEYYNTFEMDVDNITTNVERELVSKGEHYIEDYNRIYNPTYIAIIFNEMDIESIVNEFNCRAEVKQFLNSINQKRPELYNTDEDEEIKNCKKIDKLFSNINHK